MSRVIKTVSADGSSSGAGLTTADVNTLIQAKSEWEFIRADELTSTVSQWVLGDGIDNDTYAAYKYVFTKLVPNGSAYYGIRIQNTAGTNLNFTYFSHISNTSHAYASGTSSSILYFYGSTSGLNNAAEMFLEVEVQQNDVIQGYFKSGMAYPAGYWQHDTSGSFICTSEAHVFGSLELPFGFQGGKVSMYGRRHRSAS